MRPRTFVPFGNTVFPSTTTGSARLAENVSPALLVSVPTASIIATVIVVPEVIVTVSTAGAVGPFGAGVSTPGTLVATLGAWVRSAGVDLPSCCTGAGVAASLPDFSAGGVGVLAAGAVGCALDESASVAGRLQAITPSTSASVMYRRIVNFINVLLLRNRGIGSFKALYIHLQPLHIDQREDLTNAQFPNSHFLSEGAGTDPADLFRQWAETLAHTASCRAKVPPYAFCGFTGVRLVPRTERSTQTCADGSGSGTGSHRDHPARASGTGTGITV